MLRSRVTSGVDMVRLGNALSRPGIDPRIWVSYATLISEVYVDTQAGSQGVFADVQLLPSGVEDTARVGAIYAGNGFGLYTPLHKDDEVLVVAPSGDPDEGLVIVQRLWSTSDPQPAEVVQDADDVVLVVEPDKNLRVAVKGAGNIYLTSVDGKVVLGEEAATKGVARLDDTTVNGSLSFSVTPVLPVPPPPAIPMLAVNLNYTPPGALTPTSTASFQVLSTAGAAPVPLTSVDLKGQIDAASDKVVSA